MILSNLRIRESLGYGAIPYDVHLGCISVLRGDQHFFESDRGPIPPMACQFSQASHQELLGVADEDGIVSLYNTTKIGSSALVQAWQAHGNAIFDMTWAPTAYEMLTASGDKAIAQWDVELKKRLGVFEGHENTVKSVCYRPDDNYVFGSGARDGVFKVWDCRIKRKGEHAPVAVLTNAHAVVLAEVPNNSKRSSKKLSKGPQQSVTAVCFSDEYTAITSGATDGCVKVWDLRKLKAISKMRPEPLNVFESIAKKGRKHGFSSLALDRARTRLFANCLDSIVYEFDLATCSAHPSNQYTGHSVDTFYIRLCLSPHDDYLLSGSSGGQAYVWPTTGYKPAPIVLDGHSAEVGAVAWCPKDTYTVATCSDDSTVMVWRLHPQAILESEGLGHLVIGRAKPPPVRSSRRLKSTLHPKLVRQLFATGNSPKSPAVARFMMSPTKSSPFKAAFGSNTGKMLRNLPSSSGHTPSIINFLSRARDPTPRKLAITPRKVQPSPAGPTVQNITRSSPRRDRKSRAAAVKRLEFGPDRAYTPETDTSKHEHTGERNPQTVRCKEQEQTTPRKMQITPQRTLATPQRTQTTPQQMPTTPQRSLTTPQQTLTTPQQTLTTPQQVQTPESSQDTPPPVLATPPAAKRQRSTPRSTPKSGKKSLPRRRLLSPDQGPAKKKARTDDSQRSITCYLSPKPPAAAK